MSRSPRSTCQKALSPALIGPPQMYWSPVAPMASARHGIFRIYSSRLQHNVRVQSILLVKNIDVSLAIPLMYVEVHQAAVRSVKWIMSPPYVTDAAVDETQHPETFFSTSYAGTQTITDLRLTVPPSAMFHFRGAHRKHNTRSIA